MTYTVADEDRQGGQTIKNGQIIKSVVHMKDCKNRRFRYGFTKQASKNLSQNLTFSQKKFNGVRYTCIWFRFEIKLLISKAVFIC